MSSPTVSRWPDAVSKELEATLGATPFSWRVHIRKGANMFIATAVVSDGQYHFCYGDSAEIRRWLRAMGRKEGVNLP